MSNSIPYRKEIDGLRGIAVLSIIFFHAGFKLFKGGFVGVDVFFVISGYLITSIILNEKYNGTFSFIGFYERRMRRIFPALFFVALVCLPFAWFWMDPIDLRNFSQSIMAVSTFMSNIFFWKQSGYFTTCMELKPLLHTWSLAVEEQYYLFFPMFLLITWKLGNRVMIIFLVIIIIISFTLSQWGIINAPAATFYLLPTRVWELLIGSILAFFLFLKKNLKNSLIKEIIGLFGLLLIIYSVIFFDKKIPFPGSYALIPTVGTVVVILCSTKQTFIGKLLSNNFLVGLGLISYSAYLWHQPLFAFTKLYNIKNLTIFANLCLVLLSIIFAYFTWRYIECVFRKKILVSKKIIFSSTILGSIFMFCIGLIGHFNNGFENRYNIRSVIAESFVFPEADSEVCYNAYGIHHKKIGYVI